MSHSRRQFLITGTVLGAGALTACSYENTVNPIKTTALTKVRRDELSPDELIQLAKDGNARFIRGEQRPQDFHAQQQSSADGQNPAAVLLSCMDSRAPAEILLDLGIGDVFNSRVAGNVVNEDMLGSMEYACEIAGAKLVLVMGHTACGAIKGAIDNAKLGNLTALLTKIQPAIEATAYVGERTSHNLAFVDAVARINVEFAIRAIRTNSPVLLSMEQAGKIRIAGAMYNIGTGVVDFL